MKVINEKTSTATFPIAIVVSRFNEEVTLKLLQGAETQLERRGFRPDQTTVVWVPGAIEIPIAVQKLAQLKHSKAVIALGAVIRGETTHYDYVCDQVSRGCSQVALQFGVPVIFGVLTTENEEQALDRAGGKHGNKGAEAVDAAIEMVSVLQKLDL